MGRRCRRDDLSARKPANYNDTFLKDGTAHSAKVTYSQMQTQMKELGYNSLYPTNDVVTYSDGTSEEVYGFDVPVPYLNDEFDLALVGTKGTWYDHKVSVYITGPWEVFRECSGAASNSWRRRDPVL